MLVKDFFQDIKRLLQNQETFEKDCSRVYRRACLGPRKAGSSPGEMPRLGLCPVSPCQPGGLGLACMEHLESRGCSTCPPWPLSLCRRALHQCQGRRGWLPPECGIWAKSYWKQGEAEMPRGTKEASGSALSQSPGAGWSLTRRNGGTAVPPARCMTLAVSLQLPRASVSPGQAFRESAAAGLEEPWAVFAWRRCLAAILCRSCAMSLCRGGR